jgi:hypothetical protein
MNAASKILMGWPHNNFRLTRILNSVSEELNSNLAPPNFVNFIKDANALGPVRFVVVAEGAILESIGKFDNLRTSQTSKGLLATLSGDDPIFECHIRLNEVKEIRLVIVEKFDKILKIIRFFGAKENVLLSAIVQENNHGIW